MSIRSGLAAQLGIGVESTWGTAATANRFFEFNDESLQLTIERIESAGLRATNRVLRSDRFAVGKRAVAGNVKLDGTAENTALLFKHALGANSSVNTSGTVNTHTAVLGDPYSLGMSIEVGRPGNDGTVRSFVYSGCKVADMTITQGNDAILELDLGFAGKDETVGGSLASASYPASQELLTFAGASITLAGQSFPCKDFMVKVDNGLNVDRRFLGSNLINEPIAEKYVDITGDVTAEFVDATAYNRVVSASTASLTATFIGSSISGTYKRGITISMPVCRFDGDTPNVGGPGIVEQKLTFKALYDGSQQPITITTVNTDTAA